VTGLDRQRARRLVTAAEASRRSPLEGVGLPESNGRATLAREAVEDHLNASEACQLEAFEQALAVAVERASVAFYAQEGWVNAVRAGVVALLELFDEEPELAMYLVVHSARAGDAVLARRSEVLEKIAELLDDERAPARGYPPPLTARAVANGVLGVLSERLREVHGASLVELAAPLMSFMVLPFLGLNAARRELAGAHWSAGTADGGAEVDVLKGSAGRLNTRASRALNVISAEPGLSNKELAARVGVKDDGHASRLTARLERLGLIENARGTDRRFGRKAWRLTAAGVRVREAIEREASTPEPTSAFDLPQELAGRIDDRAIVMLRVIADQPWLRSGEVAERAGVEDEAEARGLLGGLADLGLVVSERDVHRRGCPKVWRVTPVGEALDRAIGRETPPLPRSAAMDLMWETGGRLGENAVAVLRVVGAEPGLSNNDIASQVRIVDENSMSKLLARLAKRELIENLRNGGKHNVWRLTVTGERLERVIWQETPPEQQRRVALTLVRDRGGRLNHRVVAVLQAIGAEPQLSNKEIAERVGIEVKGHASTLLTRLARLGLIENVVRDPAPFEANAWVLTATGRELAAAVEEDASHV
jgi:DNA-binding MarR family transcriptional regulator